MISYIQNSSLRYLSFFKPLSATVIPLTIITLMIMAPLPSAWAADISDSCSNSTLDILLTNDDGYDAGGITALYQSLDAAGHRVTLIAPETNASGSSASVNFGKIRLRKIPNDSLPESPDASGQRSSSSRYAISGSPATAVILAVTGIYPKDSPPDLVISGINKGANLGPATPISGTVGATTAAITQLDSSIPAIAISTDPLGPDPYNSDPIISGANSVGNQTHLRNIASFITRVVAALQQHRCATGRLIPEGIALNMNYPPRAPAEILGLLVTKQSKHSYYSISYRPQPEIENKPGADSTSVVFAAAFKKLNVDSSNLNFDTSAYHAGYITVVPLTGNMGGAIDSTVSDTIRSTMDGNLAEKTKSDSILAQLTTLLTDVPLLTPVTKQTPAL